MVRGKEKRFSSSVKSNSNFVEMLFRLHFFKKLFTKGLFNSVCKKIFTESNFKINKSYSETKTSLGAGTTFRILVILANRDLFLLFMYKYKLIRSANLSTYKKRTKSNLIQKFLNSKKRRKISFGVCVSCTIFHSSAPINTDNFANNPLIYSA